MEPYRQFLTGREVMWKTSGPTPLPSILWTTRHQKEIEATWVGELAE